MRNKCYSLFTAILLTGNLTVGAQILSQNFEGSMTGWSNQGVVVTGENSVNPHAGSKMVSLSIGDELLSPAVTLPSGSKYISFWYNSYYTTNSPNYHMELDILQFGSSNIFPYVYYMQQSWQFVSLAIPSSYTGTDNQFQFLLPNNFTGLGSADYRFYLDDILVTTQNPSALVENDMQRNFKISTQNKTVEVFAAFAVSDLSIEVYNINGKKVASTFLETLNEKTEMHLGELASGLYTVRLSSGENSLMKKIIL